MPFSFKQFVFFFAMMAQFAIIAQQVEAIDKKGSVVNVNNNKVTTGATAPSDPIENDVWFDTSDNNNARPKIWNGTLWVGLDYTGIPGSIFYTGADSYPTQDNSNLFWDSSNRRLGIGTASPSSTFDVVGDVEFNVPNGAQTFFFNSALLGGVGSRMFSTEPLAFQSNFNGPETPIAMRMGTINNNNALTFKKATGEIGIRTDDATANLDINGDARIRTLPIGANTDEIVTADTDGNLRKVTVASIGDGDAWAVDGEDLTTQVVRNGNVHIDDAANAGGTRGFRIFNDTNAVFEALSQTGDAYNSFRSAGGNMYTQYLDLSGPTRWAMGFEFASKDYYIQNAANLSSGGADFMVQNGTGNVGIGITTPSSSLDVNGDARIRSLPAGVTADELVTADTNGNLRKRTVADVFADAGANENIYTANGTLTGNRVVTQNNFDVNFDANTLVIDGSANRVGIGTNDPQRGFHAAANDFVRFSRGSNTAGIVVDRFNGSINNTLASATFGLNSTAVGQGEFFFANYNEAVGGGGFTRWITFDIDTNQISFNQYGNNNYTGSAAYLLAVDANGNLIEIDPNTLDTDTTIYDTDGALSANRSITQNNFDLNFDTNTFVVSGDDDNVGIGTATPSTKLDVNGEARIRTLPTGTSADELVIADTNGNLRKLPITSLETKTSIAQNNTTGVVTHNSEDGTSQSVNIVSTNANNNISAGTDGGAYYSSPIKAYGKLIPATNSIVASGISAATKTAVGRFTFTFATARSSANYPIQLTALETGTDDINIYVTAQTTTTFSISIIREVGGTFPSDSYVDRTCYFTVLDF